MGTRSATRSQILVTLRRWMPNASVRRLGDLLDRAKLIELEGKASPTTQLAFGLVLDGTLRVAVEGGETRWVRPGEVFGMAQYELNHEDHRLTVTKTTKTAQFLAFSHADIVMQGFGWREPLPK